jgi:TRAP-type mannitol/chloroaromatic compound transport system permease small subunit
MSDKATQALPDLVSKDRLLVKFFGWNVIGFLLAFLINNFLSLSYDFPGVIQGLYSWSVLGLIQLGVYVLVCSGISYLLVLKSNRTLRQDSALVNSFNIYLIRGLFWSVLFIGIIDVAIAFVRVERIFPLYIDDDLIRLLNKPTFIGPNIHIPIFIFSFVLALFTKTLGFVWLSLLIVLAELLIVISRFVFSYEQPFMADLVRYWYAALFLFASAYTLYDEGHVRVDILYAGLSQKTKGLLNAVGAVFLGLTTSLLIVLIGFNGKYSIVNKPLMSFEVSQTGTVGMFVKYQMALFLGIFGITMTIQFVSCFFESIADYRGDSEKRKVTQEKVH